MAPAEYLSGAWRLGLAAGYAALLAVNGVYGSGAFGVPTNADISGASPSPVTPGHEQPRSLRILRLRRAQP